MTDPQCFFCLLICQYAKMHKNKRSQNVHVVTFKSKDNVNIITKFEVAHGKLKVALQPRVFQFLGSSV